MRVSLSVYKCFFIFVRSVLFRYNSFVGLNKYNNTYRCSHTISYTNDREIVAFICALVCECVLRIDDAMQ